MEVLKALHDAIDGIGRMPLIYDLRKSRYDRRFEAALDLNLFRGLYRDFASARAAIPATKPAGYDHSGPASMYDERTGQIFVSDYPVLYWLSNLFDKGCRSVFDVGGHIGVAYYAYQRYLRFPEQVQWKIFDVPAVVERGKEIAESRDKTGRLTFTTEFDEASRADILFASGSLQYLPETLWNLLRDMGQKPKYVLANLLPLHASKTYYTVQTIGTAFCPYRIESRDSFLNGLSDIGYQLIDVWENLDKRCDIPFEPATYSLDRYHGLCLRRS